MPRSPVPIRNETKQNKKIFPESRRKAQKEHRTPIRPAPMHKKIIMQKNMQKINLCRPGMQLFVDMP